MLRAQRTEKPEGAGVSVRILFVEDNQDDVELQLRRLRDAGFDPQWDRVQSEGALRAALDAETWHVALVDYDLPGFSGLDALHLIVELAPDLPAVTVSGAIDEEAAVATISAGAVDYVLKHNLTRLAPAVRRAVAGADLRRAHRQAAESASLALFSLDHASLAIATMAPDGTIVYVNDYACTDYARDRADLVGSKIWEADPGMEEAEWERTWERAVREGVLDFRSDRVRPDGERLVLDVTANHLAAADVLVIYGRDITARVEAEESTRRHEAQVRESEARFRGLAEAVPGFVTIKDPDHRYLYLSSLWGALDECGEQAWLGMRPEGVWPAAEAADSNETARRALAGEMVDEVTSMRRGEEVRHFHSLHFPIERDGAPPLVGGLTLDVTEQVEAQEEVRRQAEQLRRTVEGAVLAMSQVVEMRDPYTAGHERRVAELATAVGRDLGLTDAELDGLRLGALIHDIGKIAVPAEILAKPCRLSTVESNLLRQHPVAGHEILSVIDFGRPVAEIVLQHHERLDGSGYPHGLTTQDLLPEARILAVADVVEAMSSHRPYRAALGTDAALEELREGAGTRYDADVVTSCRRVLLEQGFRFTP
jgi:putative nucleotidyltransferase with HDIG domain/PAS domain S-box-containing protein